MKNIEMLDETNKDTIFAYIPNTEKYDKVYMKIKSLRSNYTWYVLANHGNTLTCYLDGKDTSCVRQVYKWEFWEDDCYVDRDFKSMSTAKLMSKIGSLV